MSGIPSGMCASFHLCQLHSLLAPGGLLFPWVHINLAVLSYVKVEVASDPAYFAFQYRPDSAVSKPERQFPCFQHSLQWSHSASLQQLLLTRWSALLWRWSLWFSSDCFLILPKHFCLMSHTQKSNICKAYSRGKCCFSTKATGLEAIARGYPRCPDSVLHLQGTGSSLPCLLVEHLSHNPILNVYCLQDCWLF